MAINYIVRTLTAGLESIGHIAGIELPLRELAMDTSIHDLNALFLQLGLPNHDGDIDGFIERHHLDHAIPLNQAPFWTPTQTAFLHEAISEDSDWCEAVDVLDSRLRK